MRAIDLALLHRLEKQARKLANLIGYGIEKGHGFVLMVFSFDGPEMTWISNANREDMIKVLDEFKAALINGAADELSRPKGSG